MLDDATGRQGHIYEIRRPVRVPTVNDAGKTAPRTRRWSVRQLASRGGFLLLTGVSIYLVGPSLLEVFTSWDEVSTLEPYWLAIAMAMQAISFGFVWAVQRVALRTSEWFPVITSQLAGNAAGRVLPGGAAMGSAVQFSLLRTAGIGTANATSGLTAAGLLQLGTTCALPVMALPALVLSTSAPGSLLTAAWIGAGLFIVLLLFSIAILADDRLLTWIGGVGDSVCRRLSKTSQRQSIAVVLINERNLVRSGLGSKWVRAAAYSIARAVFDFVTLLTALAAFGVDAQWSLVLLAYASAMLLGMIPFTPGGLGFVEAGLTGVLALAGVPTAAAISATLLYRLVSFWLPIPIGLIAGITHRVRFGAEPAASV
ncbi:MAG: hypothetical protein ACJA07_004910 [Rhodococcus sp. (in: high G+C Gram-positive bacteria)]